MNLQEQLFLLKWNNKTETKSSLGFSDLLLLLFIYLKLTHQVDWSWLYVLSPLWISFTIVVILGVIKNWKED